MTWDLAIGFVYLISYFIDPFIVAFDGKPLENKTAYNTDLALTAVLFFNMALVPFSAIVKKTTIFNEDDDNKS